MAGAVRRKNKAITATKMSILDLGPYMFGDVDQQIGWFQSKGLLATSKTCPACSQPMDMQTRSDVTDKYRWRCSNTACRKSVGLRDGTFFAKSHLTLQQWMVLMYWWACQYPVTDAAQEARVEKNTAVQAYQYFRDICSWRLLNHDAPLLLGGPGVVVHIDESLFRHKPKVWYTAV